MKRVSLLFVLALCVPATVVAENEWSFKGTVVKMEMTECMQATGFKAAMAGRPAAVANCPQYTVMSPTVVYVVLGRHTQAFIPLAQDLDFQVRKNEVLVGEKSKSGFVIQTMTLRSDWEREEERKALLAQALERSVSYELRNPPKPPLLASAK